MFMRSTLNATIRCSKLTDTMSDSFYINGSMPSAGQVPVNKTFFRTVRDKVGIFGISDGFGDSANVSVAAYKTLGLFKKYQSKFAGITAENQPKIIEKYLDEANGIINSLGTAGPGSAVGSSLAMLIINKGVATAVNMGSSRAYSFKYGRLTRLSCDDTETERLLSVGAIRREEALGHPTRDLLTNYVGMTSGAPIIKPHISSPATVEKGDMFLLCSNGLTDVLSDDRIAYILSLRASDDRLVERLINEAKAKGASDNITVVLVRVGGRANSSRGVKKGTLKAVGLLLALLLAIIAIVKVVSLMVAPAPGPDTPATDSPTQTVTPTPTPEMILREE